MILQALYELAQRESLMEDPDFEMKPVAWLVRVSPEGKLLGISSTHTPSGGNEEKKSKPVPKSFNVPRERPVTSGDRAFLLFNKAEYVFGQDPEGKRDSEKLRLRFNLFCNRVRECLDKTGDEGVRAVFALLEDIQAGKQVVSLPADCASNDLFTFLYSPDLDVPITSREKVREYWRQERAKDDNESGGGNSHCLVTGRTCTPSNMFPPLKNVPGGNTSGVYGISYNSAAFESYGWSRNENAPISREAAEACSTGLNRLLSPAFKSTAGKTLPRQNVRLSGDTVVCFWTKQPSDFGSVFTNLLEGNSQDVGELYRSIWRGKMADLDDPTAFYALTLSGSKGRAIVRDWFESTVQRVARNLTQHFADLAIARNTKPAKGQPPPECFPLKTLLESLAPKGKSDDVPPPHVAALVRAALQGTLYPLSILQRGVERQRAEIGRDEWADSNRRDARAALIKAVLNRRRRSLIAPTYQEVSFAMDPTVASQGYVLGRLLAVIERLQLETMPNVNASVIDRYFSGASASPKSVFVRLLKNSRHHVSKLKGGSKYGQALRWERLIDDMAERFDPKRNGFPAYLDLEQQGLFILGYHQMRHWLWLSNEDRAAWERQNTSAPRVYLWNTHKESMKNQEEQQ